MSEVCLGSRARRGVRKPGVTRCSVTPHKTQQRTVALQSHQFLPPLPPFSPRPSFSDIKIYKGAHRVHFVTCIHKQSVSFLSQKTRGPLRERENISRRHNVHKRAQTPSCSREEQMLRGRVFSFLSLICKRVYCTWEKFTFKARQAFEGKRVLRAFSFANSCPPVSHSCSYRLSNIIN